MSDALLSTPQKVLRDSMRARMTAREIEEEQRREARRARGRESYARRKASSSSFGSSFGGGEEEEEEEMQPSPSPPQEQTKPQTRNQRRKRKSGADDDGAYVPELSADEYSCSDGGETEAQGSGTAHKRPKRKSSGPRLAGPTPPKKQKVRAEDPAPGRVVSKFIEGSMRDRASAVPPKDITGLEIDPAEELPDGDFDGVLEKGGAQDDAGSGLFGLGALGSAAGALNPFRFANRLRAAWDRQKAEYMAYERRKRMLAERKRRGQEAYQALMKRGAIDGLNTVIAGGGLGIRQQDVAMGGLDSYEAGVGLALCGEASSEGSQTSDGAEDMPLKERGEKSEVTTSVGSDTSERCVEDIREGGARGYTRGDSSVSDRSHASSSAQQGHDRRSGNGTISSRHLRGLSRSSMRMLSPPLTEGATNKLNEVKTLVKKKSKIFVSSLTGKDDGATKTEGKEPTKREIKKQERLKSKVSNLEEQLEKAKKELENVTKGTNAPPVPKISQRPSAARKHKPRGTVLSDEYVAYEPVDTDEGEDTEVDQVDEGFPMAPLSPVMDTSFGGSFNATALAGMTIMENFTDGQGRSAAVGNHKRTASRETGLRALPKRASTPILGPPSWRNPPGPGPSSLATAKVKGGKSSPPPPPPDAKSKVVPPVPRLSRRSSGL